jgi:kynureninase
MFFESTLEFAKSLDQRDPLRSFREEFLFPDFHKKDLLYFTGNSLGLQPKNAKKYLLEELEDWQKYGVEGHFISRRPWYSYHENLTDMMAEIVGAKPLEVVVTHSLTTNLHLLMVSFFRPEGKRTKIICEEKAFPSDQYAIESQLKFHGLGAENLIEIAPRKGEFLIREEDIIAKINEIGDELALVMIGGVNYYSGQLFDMKSITTAGHSVGAKVGFDLAHAAGNVELYLNAWGVDFAAWCGYKYLNSSPGGVAGMFVHERHANNINLPRFAGWWGHNKDTRFEMKPGFSPIPGAEGWQLSNAPVLGMAVQLASLEIFKKASMRRISEKRDLLTAYLEYIILGVSERNKTTCSFEIITPSEPAKRGAQLSMLVHGKGKELFEKLSKNGVVADWREPNVIRVAPAPLYTSFEDCYWFGKFLEDAIQ